jgi:hypothetical protein
MVGGDDVGLIILSSVTVRAASYEKCNAMEARKSAKSPSPCPDPIPIRTPDSAKKNPDTVPSLCEDWDGGSGAAALADGLSAPSPSYSKTRVQRHVPRGSAALDSSKGGSERALFC